MDPTISRRMWRTLEPIHAAVYFAPEAEREYTALGLAGSSDRLLGYFPSRAAAMGAVSVGVVQATFFNFAPRAVESGLAGVWERIGPERFVRARWRIVDGVLRRLCPETIGRADLAEAAKLARRACEGCHPYGRPLYAGNADLPWPDEPHLQLWHATTLLREFRGDGHIAALVTEGYRGLDAAVTHAAQEGASWKELLRISRGYTHDEWNDAVDRLRERGDLDERGQFTEQGAARRQRVEDATDELALPVWAALGESDAARLRALARPIAITLAASDGLRLPRSEK